MKLFKLFRSINSMVVAAPDSVTARTMHPTGVANWGDSSWACSLEEVDVEYLGEAADGTEQGIIISSYNAG